MGARSAKEAGKTKAHADLTTVVCNALIPTIRLSYYPTDPEESKEVNKGLRKLSYYGKFNMEKDGNDNEIWEGDPL